MIAVGLIACAAAALLSTDQPIGAAEVEWGAPTPIPESKPVAIPGGGTMRIGQAGLRATAPNGGGYRLYRIAAALEISRSAAVGHGRVRCLVQVPAGALVARTPNGRAAYPQPSEDLAGQPVARNVKIEFSIEGTDLAAVSLGDAFKRFASEPGVKAEWTKYEPARQGWDWGLPGGHPSQAADAHLRDGPARSGEASRPHRLHRDHRRRRRYREDGRGSLGSDQQLRAFLDSFADFVQLRVGRGA